MISAGKTKGQVIDEIREFLNKDYNLSFYDVLLHAYRNDKDDWVRILDSDKMARAIANFISINRPSTYQFKLEGLRLFNRKEILKMIDSAKNDYRTRKLFR